MIGSGDDVDRTAKNPNRVTQPFDRIGKGDDVSEREATERYAWSKARQALKSGDTGAFVRAMNAIYEGSPDVFPVIERRIAKTFTAGCAALGDPAPLDKENDHE
jgi:hypothetical protein